MGFLRLHHLVPASRANGPGTRAVVWVQGCSLGCPGCFNPETHAPEPGERVDTDELFHRLVALEGIQGVTFSGGEPLQQRTGLLAVLRRLRRETDLSVVLFTGFSYDEIAGTPAAEVFELVDVMLAGRYRQDRRVARGLLGSANKTMHFFTDRYGPGDFVDLPEAEILIGPEGHLVLTGIDPLQRETAP